MIEFYVLFCFGLLSGIWNDFVCIFFFQAEDGIRDLVRSRGLGDVYKRQAIRLARGHTGRHKIIKVEGGYHGHHDEVMVSTKPCLLYTSDAADERSSVDLGGRRIINKKNK